MNVRRNYIWASIKKAALAISTLSLLLLFVGVAIPQIAHGQDQDDRDRQYQNRDRDHRNMDKCQRRIQKAEVRLHQEVQNTATAAGRPIVHGRSSVPNATVATAHTISGGMAATGNGIRTETGIVILAATATTMTETATPAALAPTSSNRNPSFFPCLSFAKVEAQAGGSSACSRLRADLHSLAKHRNLVPGVGVEPVPRVESA